jgi:hypothetical protein
VITGGVRSVIQVIVLDAVAVLPQPSMAVHVLVCERSHPLEPTAPSLGADTVGIPQPSVADAVPSAALISAAEGLHPSAVVVPPVVITGGVRSVIQVIVLDAVAVLPQPSMAVHVLVCERSHPLEPTAPSLGADTVGIPQPSVADAVPSAALISAAEGLHPSAVVVPPVVITGGVRSVIQVIVLDAVAVLPQPSMAVHVLVCERSHPLEPTAPSLGADTVGIPQPSVADAVPSAALISAAEGLHPSAVVVPPVVITGGVRSVIQVIVLDAVAVLPQPSMAVHVLVCERSHPLEPTAPSLGADTVGIPQPSVADAVPSAALISAAEGLHPSAVVVPPVVITGGVRSVIQVIVLDAVAVLPQPSMAVHVLVCERSHPLEPTAPSLGADTVGIPQPSVADAVPSAALISAAEGLHPSAVVVHLL